MFTDASVGVWSSPDWKDEIVAVRVRVAELPVPDVSGVSEALKGQGQLPVVVGH